MGTLHFTLHKIITYSPGRTDKAQRTRQELENTNPSALCWNSNKAPIPCCGMDKVQRTRHECAPACVCCKNRAPLPPWPRSETDDSCIAATC